LKLQAKIFK